MCYHALFLSVMAGGAATVTTVIMMLSIDLILALFFLIQIIYLKKKGSEESLINAIQSLVLAETVELTIPVFYTICFMLAYFGPNAEVLGNIKNSYFHYVAVEDIWSSFEMLCIIMGLDIVLLVITVMSLYIFAGINFFKVTELTARFFTDLIWRQVYLHIQKEYGVALGVQQAYVLGFFFCNIAIGCAMDWSFQFEWLDPDGSMNFDDQGNMVE